MSAHTARARAHEQPATPSPKMKILVSSYAFAPSIGGIEELTEVLALEFARRGHDVTIVTMTPNDGLDDYPFTVVRRPNAATLIQCIDRCDVYLQEHISIRFAWPLLLRRKPWVVALQTPLSRADSFSWRAHLKRQSLRFAHIIACSRAAARDAPCEAVVIPNPFRRALFRRIENVPRTVDAVFLGRLVPDKGVPVLIDALAMLRNRGFAASLMVIGGGPDESAIRSMVERLGLTNQVRFAGPLRGEELARHLNMCRVMVVPSVYEEPFGIVALEGIACGCAVVASNAGGLPDAVGPCGVTFPKGDSTALADRLMELLVNDREREGLMHYASAHLARHNPQAVAEAYLTVIERARRNRSAKR